MDKQQGERKKVRVAVLVKLGGVINEAREAQADAHLAIAIRSAVLRDRPQSESAQQDMKATERTWKQKFCLGMRPS